METAYKVGMQPGMTGKGQVSGTSHALVRYLDFSL